MNIRNGLVKHLTFLCTIYLKMHFEILQKIFERKKNATKFLLYENGDFSLEPIKVFRGNDSIYMWISSEWLRWKWVYGIRRKKNENIEMEKWTK